MFVLLLSILLHYNSQARNRNKNRNRRYKIKLIKERSNLSSIKSTFNSQYDNSSHYLLHVSSKEWINCKDNAIMLGGLFYGYITSYHSFVMEQNITAPLKKSTAHGNTICWQELNVAEVNREFAIIVTTTHNLDSLIRTGSVILIDSTEGSTTNRAFNNKSTLSGYVLLALIHLCKKNNRSGLK